MKILKEILNYLRMSGRFRLVGAGMLTVLVWIGLNAALAQQNSPGSTKKNSEEEVVSEEDAEVFPESVFNNEIGQGRDPFFPASTRRQPKEKPKSNNSGSNKKTNEPDLTKPDLTLYKVKGIIGGSIALINGRTFEKGESALVKTSKGEVEIECVQVSRDSVDIRIQGYTGSHRLYLGGVK